MLLPLFLLALGALFAGYIGYDYFVGEKREAFWAGSLFFIPGHDIIEHAHHVPDWVKKAPLYAGVLGIALAYALYLFGKGALPARLAKGFGAAHRFLLNRWYIDVLYYHVFVRSALWLGRLFWKQGDVGIVDRFGPNGLAALTTRTALGASRLQTGYLYHYAFAMLIAVTLALTVFVLKG
jgi:NADH-quinone oxidoreductase subunit L